MNSDDINTVKASISAMSVDLRVQKALAETQDVFIDKYGEEAGLQALLILLWYPILCSTDMEAAGFVMNRCREAYEKKLKEAN